MVTVRTSPSGPLVDTGGGGSISPLSTALVVDPEATGDTPNGSWSGTQAFPTLTEGVAALPVGERASLYLCTISGGGTAPIRSAQTNTITANGWVGMTVEAAAA